MSNDSIFCNPLGIVCVLSLLGGGGISLSLLLWLRSAESWWWSTDLAVSSRSVTHVTMMDSRGNTEILLQVQLWKCVSVVNGGLCQVSHGSGVNHVSDHVLFDSLVLWDSGRRVLAPDESDMSATLLVTSVISSLFSHFLDRVLLDIRNRTQKWDESPC